MNVLMELKNLLAAQCTALLLQFEIGISISFACKSFAAKSFPFFVKDEISFLITLSEMFSRLSCDAFVCAIAAVVTQ